MPSGSGFGLMKMNATQKEWIIIAQKECATGVVVR